ncbi:hypothetical protein ON010_g3402 [Phytophthora cinnamomi]|nr:hypothetical protein ON010_g3402 [Phytophthora cinnamomi]
MSSLPVENTSVVGETDATDMLLASDIGEQRRKRRNERDRKRSAARKVPVISVDADLVSLTMACLVQEELNEMRKLVQEMEEKKNALVKKTSGTARVFSHIKDLALPSSPDSCSFISSVSTSTLTTASVREYVRLTAEAEAYRCQNAMMTKQLVERDLLYTILRTGLLEASQDKHSRVGSHFIPLSHEDGLTCMRKTLQYINNARLLYANDDSFQDRPTIFGWSQYCKRNGASINFAVRKSLLNVTPRELADTTWHLRYVGAEDHGRPAPI